VKYTFRYVECPVELMIWFTAVIVVSKLITRRQRKWRSYHQGSCSCPDPQQPANRFISTKKHPTDSRTITFLNLNSFPVFGEAP
jgi:hypothetical protein